MLPLLGITLLFSCDSDSKQKPYNDQSEAQYFKDYESPMHKWGLLDTSGKEFLPAIYDDLKDPIDINHIPASLGGKWSYINSHGKPIIPFQFQSVEAWSNGAGWAKNFDGTYQIITDHQISDTLWVNAVRPFNSDLAPVLKGSMWSYVDLSGQLVITGQYIQAGQFDKYHQAIIKTPKGYGVINNNGKVIIEPTNHRIKIDQDGYLIKSSEETYQYVTSDGQPRWDTQYQKAEIFNDQYALVKTEQTYALINVYGKIIRSLPYSYIESGGNGYWKYRMNNKWGILDSKGDILSDAIYDDCYRFEEGYLVASMNEQWGILDKNLNIFLPFKYPLLWSFKNGYARIIEDGYIQVIDTSGTLLPHIQEIELRDFHNNLARFQKYTPED